MVRNRISKTSYGVGLLTIILAGAAGWALYKIINQGAVDLLTMFGVTNIYAQYGSVLVFIIFLFILSGLGLKKSVEKIIK